MRLPLTGFKLEEQYGLATVMAIATKKRKQGGLECFFRTINDVDFGVDAQIEFTTVREGKRYATGRLIAVQVKAGPSYFKDDNPDKDTITNYPEEKNVAYWRISNLPTIYVIVHPDTLDAFWANVNTIRETSKGYAIDIPKANKFSAASWEELTRLTEVEQQDISATINAITEERLHLITPWLLSLDEGERVIVEVKKGEEESDLTIQVRYQLSNVELVAPEYIEDQDELARRETFDVFTTSLFSSVQSAVDIIFDWADVVPLQPTQEAQDEFESHTSSLDDYEDPIPADEYPSFESILQNYFDAEEQLYLSTTYEGDKAYLFSLSMNERSKKLLEVIQENAERA